MTNAAEPKVIPAMTAHLSKFALTAHIISSVGWFGAVAAFLVLSVAGRTSQDAEVVRSSYLAMNLIGLFVIVPLSLAALLTGLIQSLGTHWGTGRNPTSDSRQRRYSSAARGHRAVSVQTVGTHSLRTT